LAEVPVQSHVGVLSSLPIQVESDLEALVRTSAQHGFHFSKADVRSLVGSYVSDNYDKTVVVGMYLREHCRFVEKTPSADWVTDFMYHHLHKPSSVERVRKEAACDPFTIYHFYNILDGLVAEPAAFYNLDETGFFLDPQSTYAIVATGMETRRVIAGTGHSCFTALA